MGRIYRFGAIVILWVVGADAAVFAGEGWPGLVKKLIERPAPAADWRPHAPFSESPPPEDAQLEVLAAWWGEEQYGSLEDISPSEKVRQRLVQAVKDHPADLARLVHWFPESAETRSLVERLKSEYANQMADYWTEIVSEWLDQGEARSDDELFEEVENVHYTDGELVGEDVLHAIVHRDRARARSVLRELSVGDDQRIAALALRLLYEDSLRDGAPEEDRFALRRIVTDSNQPPFARDLAVEALMSTRWSGRDEWFLALFSDGSLSELHEDVFLLQPLVGGVASDPNELIPKVARLVGNENRAIHDNAVACLVQFHIENARVDALRPLLPWLAEPSWSSSRDRLRLIQSLDRVRLPESVPGLIEILRRERFYARQAAAQALAFYGDHRALPALKEVLDEEKDERQRRFLLHALAACGGFSADEQAAALEAFSRQISTEEGRNQWEKARCSHSQGSTIDSKISLGSYLSDGSRVDEAMAERLYAQADALVGSEPETSGALRRILVRWPKVIVTTKIVDAIRQGKADVEMLTAALAQRDVIARNADDTLRMIAKAGGYAAGVASALLGDSELREEILLRMDREAQISLLACARLTRTSLSIAVVGSLLKVDNNLLRRAAEAYLIAEDSPAARGFVVAHHPGEMIILGARSSHDAGHFSFHDLGKWGQNLVTEMQRENAPDEIFALLSAGYWGDAGQKILFARKDKTELIERLDESRYRRRVLGIDEWNEFRKFVEQSQFFDLPPLTTSVWDGLQYEAIHLTRSGGRRVFMNNPGDAGSAGSAYHLLVRRFHRLAAFPTSPIRHDICDEMPEARVVLSGQEVLAVGGTNDNIAVLIEDGETPTWRKLEGAELGKPIPRPSGWPDGKLRAVNETFMRYPHLNPSPWQARLGEGVVLAGILKKRSTYSPALRWFKIAGGSEIMATGTYANPIVTSDGKWLLAAKAGRRGWAEPNSVVRIRLGDREEFPLELPAADTFEPVAWIGGRNSVLLYRAQDDESEPGYFLCDPATGATREVRGSFKPWFHAQKRPLQPTGEDGEVWAAIPGKNRTDVGRYRSGDFTFIRVATFSRIVFNSLAMWVDEKSQIAYVAHGGDLLALPLPY